MVKRFIPKILTACFLAYALAGCVATLPTTDGRDAKTADSYEQYLADAEQKLKAGQRETAIAALSEAAKVAPTRKEPWLRMAQIHFDTANYGQAITAAQEVLSRDGTDKGARSILAVSGLRVSLKALSELRADNALSGDARTEAESLARSLRDTLGATVLVPGSGHSPGATPQGGAPAVGGAVTNPVPRAKTPARPTIPQTPSGTNPFGSLK
jgi:tetratricopeptide (TPR) repeat protein